MEATLLIVRLVLAGTFATAGVAKLADLAGSRQAMRDFGLPDRLSAPAGLLLPLAELTVAVTLVPATTAAIGAAGALALLVLFIVAIGTNLARGRQPDCHCFGQLHSSPAGWTTLLRNAVLATGAALVAFGGPGPTVGSRPPDTDEPIAWCVAIALAVVISAMVKFGVALLRQNGRLLLRIEDLEQALATLPGGRPAPVRTPAPDFQLPGVHGETVTLASLLAPGRPLLLLFTDPKCGPCNSLMPDVGRWQHSDAFNSAVVSRGDIEANRAKAVEHGVSPMLLQTEREVALSYGAAVTPCAVVVDADGYLASKVARGPAEIRALAATLAAAPPPSSSLEAAPTQRGLAIGTPAPPIRLPDLGGRTAEGSDRDRPTMVLFWDPGCGFCQRMLPELQAWEADPPPTAPALLVVSKGDVDANRAQGLRAPVLIAPNAEVMTSYRANGTPMAVLVDTDGLVASALAVGSGEVMSLLTSASAPADRPST